MIRLSPAARLAAVGVAATLALTVTAGVQSTKADDLQQRVGQLERRAADEHAAAVRARADADAARAGQRRAEDDAAAAQARLAAAAERERARVVRASRSRRLVGPADVPTPETPSGSGWRAWAASRDARLVSDCESGGNPRAVNPHGAGYYGKWQFALATWRSVGGTGNPAAASEDEQDRRAWLLWKRDGWGQWECAGMRGVR